MAAHAPETRINSQQSRELRTNFVSGSFHFLKDDAKHWQ